MESLALKTAPTPPVAPEDAERDAVLTRYRRYRALTRDHNKRILAFLPKGALLNQARRLGLGPPDPVEIEDWFLALDLVIHTAPPGRSRVIDRYVRAAGAEPGSDDERVLAAMREARFAIVGIERRHDLAGLVVRDVSSLEELWLMDEHLGSSGSQGLFATRLFEFDDFHITAGVLAPVDEGLLRDVLLELPFLANKTWSATMADRRFAETLYRVALEDGLMGGVRYADVADGANVDSEARRQWSA